MGNRNIPSDTKLQANAGFQTKANLVHTHSYAAVLCSSSAQAFKNTVGRTGEEWALSGWHGGHLKKHKAL